MPERRRRKSLSIFRPSVTGLTPIYDGEPESAPPMLSRIRRPASFFSTSSPTSGGSPDSEFQRVDSNKSDRSSPIQQRPRTLQKSGRPSSIFGSFRSFQSIPDDEENDLTRTSSRPESIDEEGTGDVAGSAVLHHGEVQISGGVFRKKAQYLVLTDTHLIRFKSQARAAEVFPSIPASLGRSNTFRHSRMSSSSSLHELQTAGFESQVGIPLNSIVAVYKLDDGRPYFSTEVAHLHGDSNQAAALTLQSSDPKESDLWLTSIRGAATKARLTAPAAFAQLDVDYTARTLEQERDYDPQCFRMFSVVKRASKSGGRSSSEDLTKLTSTICFLVIGIHKIHLVPLPKSKSASSTSLADMNGSSHGITTLTAITVRDFDDAFQLTFRIPLRQPSTLYLASSSVTDIALWIRQRADYLRPEWIEQPFTWNVPQSLDEEFLPAGSGGEDHQCFDRTLTAYCAGYDVDSSNIRYKINYECEDAPAFELLQPGRPQRPRYTVLEALGIMRALRYNETFHSISFRDINFDMLHGLQDRYGADHVSASSRAGTPLDLPNGGKSCVLVEEIQAIALKSKRLRRIDFTRCFTRRPNETDGVRDPGNAICEALFPLCAKQYTNIDWIVLNGNLLADADIDWLFAAAVDRCSHLRAVDVGFCGLTERRLDTMLQAMLCQEDTLESIDFSGNPARLNLTSFNESLKRFHFVRKINLSRIQRIFGLEPVLAQETLLLWKLEELYLNEISLNELSLQAIAGYLASRRSDTLRVLSLNQCQMTGRDVAFLLRAMIGTPGRLRNLHLLVNENQLEKQHEELVDVVQHSLTPTHLSMQMLEYTKESHFRELIQAFAANTTTTCLDISKASLPYDASDETCDAMHRMLAENQTLTELDISGEQAHIEAVRFGSSLNRALTGLSENTSLLALHIEHQKLGLQGASTLASVLEVNKTLQEIHCEHNEISLQGFTVLVNAMKDNTSVMYLPSFTFDRKWSLDQVSREAFSNYEPTASTLTSKAISTRSTVKKGLGAAIGRNSRGSVEKTALPTYTENDLKSALASLDENWDRETFRLEGFLSRNMKLMQGLAIGDAEGDEDDRPPTAGTLSMALQRAMLDQTPTNEKEALLGDDFELLNLSENGEDEMDEKVGSHDTGYEYYEQGFNEKAMHDDDEEDDAAPGLTMGKETLG